MSVWDDFHRAAAAVAERQRSLAEMAMRQQQIANEIAQQEIEAVKAQLDYDAKLKAQQAEKDWRDAQLALRRDRLLWDQGAPEREAEANRKKAVENAPRDIGAKMTELLGSMSPAAAQSLVQAMYGPLVGEQAVKSLVEPIIATKIEQDRMLRRPEYERKQGRLPAEIAPAGVPIGEVLGVLGNVLGTPSLAASGAALPQPMGAYDRAVEDQFLRTAPPFESVMKADRQIAELAKLGSDVVKAEEEAKQARIQTKVAELEFEHMPEQWRVWLDEKKDADDLRSLEMAGLEYKNAKAAVDAKYAPLLAQAQLDLSRARAASARASATRTRAQSAQGGTPRETAITGNKLVEPVYEAAAAGRAALDLLGNSTGPLAEAQNAAFHAGYYLDLSDPKHPFGKLVKRADGLVTDDKGKVVGDDNPLQKKALIDRYLAQVAAYQNQAVRMFRSMYNSYQDMVNAPGYEKTNLFIPREAIEWMRRVPVTPGGTGGHPIPTPRARQQQQPQSVGVYVPTHVVPMRRGQQTVGQMQAQPKRSQPASGGRGGAGVPSKSQLRSMSTDQLMKMLLGK